LSCPNDFFAFFIGSDESKRQFEKKYPHPADKGLVESSRWFVQMEIDRGVPEVGPPINILQIIKHGAKWIQKKEEEP
jgi:hypothetical protein